MKQHAEWLKNGGSYDSKLSNGPRRANLCDANLILANLRGANLAGADLTDADLSFANLGGLPLSRLDLKGANLTGAFGLNRHEGEDDAGQRDVAEQIGFEHGGADNQQHQD